MIPSMALFVMLNLFTWLKSKVNTHSFKVKMEETTPCSEVYVRGSYPEDLVNLYFLFCKSGPFKNLGF